jgi:glutathione S-transferase
MTIAHLKLFHAPATRSARVRWALHEVVSEAFELERLDLGAGDQFAPAFASLNPNRSVPVLQVVRDDGSVQTLIESAGIVLFLAEAYPAACLLPTEPGSPQRADVLQMLQFGATSVDRLLWQIRLHEKLLPPAERDHGEAERSRRRFQEQVEPQLAERLRQGPHLCGSAFSAADLVMGHNVLWARSCGLCGERIFQRYLALLGRRPAFARAFDDINTVAP